MAYHQTFDLDQLHNILDELRNLVKEKDDVVRRRLVDLAIDYRPTEETAEPLVGADATEVPPCASEFAVELTPDNMFRHSVRVASCPHHRHAELCWPLVSCSSFMPSVTKHTCKPNSL